MGMHTKNVAQLGWDPDDPHGALHHGDEPHGHPVVAWQIQLGVLLALLFFTFLTVAFYNAEAWVETAFEIHLPWWVNVAGAMSIATVKAVLVCMFFMQLRYDKAINTFAMLFCLVCVGLFLGFSMIDLENRDRVVEWKKAEATLGGTGTALDAPAIDPQFDARISPRINTQGQSIVEFRRQEAIAAIQAEGKTEKDFWKKYYAKHAHHRHPADEANYFEALGFDHASELPDANRTFTRTGLTPGLFSAVDPSELHDAHGSDDHGDTSHDDGH